jgi:photosystem II stability/assembly factor-like uncharacterized protein
MTVRQQKILLVCCWFLLAAPVRAEWTRIGPDGGDVAEIAAAPSRPGVLYLGLLHGGVFRSADRGRTWRFAGTGLVQVPIRDLDVDPVDPDRVYAATAQGLFQTTDGGASWVQIGAGDLTGPYGGGVEQVEIHPRRPNILLTSVIGGSLFRSIDRGRTWTAEPGAPAIVESLAASPARPGLFWAGIRTGGLLKSTDSGKTWTAADQGLPAGAEIVDLAPDPRSADIVYASVSGLTTGVFKSTNGGATWKPSSEGLAGVIQEISVDAARPATLYAIVNGELFRSRNSGATWAKQATTGLRGLLRTVQPLWYGVLAGTWTGLFQSRDQGATWRASLNGLTAGSIVDLALDTQDPPRMYAVEALAGLFKSRDRGASWLLLKDGSTSSIYDGGGLGPVAVDPVEPQTVYLGLTSSIARSDNGGRRWTVHPVGSCFAPSEIEIDPRSTSTLYASGGLLSSRCTSLPNPCVLYRSLDAGESWSCIRSGLPQPTGGALAGIDPFTSEVYVLSYLEAWRSADHGDTWTQVTTGLNLYAFAPSPVEAGTLWAGLRGEVGWSRDGGQTWTFSSAGLPVDDSVIDLAFDPTDPAALYAATWFHGVFRSADTGATWAPLGTWPAGVFNYTGIELDPKDASVVYAATADAGVLRYEP